ncbi:chitobiase/beta-hexosaminidase C-terminal domain-containing protein [Bacteroides sp. HPS0048]|uniref:chitobiase/beta-hexosaminidase C-terminal domain-containing protein n=1 Tax=Bacteroides sp. HPS0048 TaxID=1078089 RepID=UPI003567E5EB
MVYTVDGTMPTAQSTLYTTPLVFMKNTTLRIATQLPSGKLSRTRIIDVRKEKMRPALRKELVSGVELQRISGKYYYVTDLVDVNWEKPMIVPGFHLDVPPEANGAFLYKGCFEVPADGVYYISSEMDQLKIDGERIINNSGKLIRHSVSRKSVALKKGVHSFELIYINSNIGGYHRYWNKRGFQLIGEDGTLTTPEVYH